MTELEVKLLSALRASHQWHIDHDDYGGYSGSELATQNIEAIVAAEFQQTKPSCSEGWIPWAGGDCPLTKATLVDIKYRSKDVVRARVPEVLRWKHLNLAGDIVAYRIVMEPGDDQSA